MDTPDNPPNLQESAGNIHSLAALGEFGLIRRLTALLPPTGEEVNVGIGDDAAVIRWGDRTLLATTDAMLEGVHFRRDWTSARDLGWKAVAVNLSDIAAMGGEPRFALITLGLPADVEPEWIEEFYRGIADLSEEARCPVIGGDTVHSPDRMVFNLTVIGEAVDGIFLTRSGAKQGDALMVTGALGDSLAGYYALKGSEAVEGEIQHVQLSKESFPAVTDGVQRCLKAHFRPIPRLQSGQAIARTGRAHAMMDLSDGLSGDVRHIAERSGVGIRIYPHRLPLSPSLIETAGYLGRDATDLALAGGEDYELLIAVPPDAADELRAAVEATGVSLTSIGEITDRPGEIVQVSEDGREEPLPRLSWDHFG